MTREEIEREKQTLPFGWGRFGKAYDHLAEISEPDESLLAAGVALTPSTDRVADSFRARWQAQFPS